MIICRVFIGGSASNQESPFKVECSKVLYSSRSLLDTNISHKIDISEDMDMKVVANYVKR